MRHSTARALALALLASVGSGVRAQAQDKPPEAIKVPAKIKKDFGERTIGILSGATRVEVLRLEPKPAPKPTPTTVGARLHQWTIAATGKEKGQEYAAKVRAFLLSGATLTIGSEPDPDQADVALRLWKDKESVTFIIHLEGGVFTLVTHDAQGKQIKVAGGSFIENTKGDYDEKGELFARVKALAVEAFPDDKKIKAVKQPKNPEDDHPPVGDKVPEQLLSVLEKGQPFELFSLDPERAKNAEGNFHGYKVLGKMTVKEVETRKKLVASLKKGVEENDGSAAGCFNPRHGIRVTHEGKTTDFVICFQCLFVQVYVDNKIEKKGLRTTSSPADKFNCVLKEAKVPLPKN